MQAKYESEVDLHGRTALDYTVLRPGLLTHKPASGVQVGRTAMRSVSREAVARVLLACALNPASAGLTLNVMDGDDTPEVALQGAVAHKADVWE